MPSSLFLGLKLALESILATNLEREISASCFTCACHSLFQAERGLKKPLLAWFNWLKDQTNIQKAGDLSLINCLQDGSKYTCSASFKKSPSFRCWNGHLFCPPRAISLSMELQMFTENGYAFPDFMI